jgi:hypothetical protein
MDDHGEMARSRAEEIGDELAIRKQEQRMAAEERAMEGEMKEFADVEECAEKQIEDELRREHWGHEPEHPPVWPNHGERSECGERSE